MSGKDIKMLREMSGKDIKMLREMSGKDNQNAQGNEW